MEYFSKLAPADLAYHERRITDPLGDLESVRAVHANVLIGGHPNRL
jgi:hypothetical protein